MSQVQALRLNENPMVDASLAFFQDAMKNGMSEKQVTLQLQTVAVIYACQGVKRNGGKTDKVKREQAACVAFRDFAVPGFLKWLATVAEPPVELPSWLTRNRMGSSTMKGADEPKLFKDPKRVWKKFMDDFCVMKRDIGPAYDRVAANGQQTTTPRSGHQYADLFVEFMDELWLVECKNKKRVKNAVNVDQEKETGQKSGGDKPAGTSGQTPAGDQGGAPIELDAAGAAGAGPEGEKDVGGAGSPPGADPEEGGGQVQGAKDTDAASHSPGAGCDKDGGAGDEDVLGPEPDEDSPDHFAWAARKKIIETREKEKAAAASRRASPYPERPQYWMHYCTLAFCFFGRPSGSDEDVDLRHCKEVSGPEGNRTPKVKIEKGGSSRTSSSGGSDDGSYDSASGPSNPLNAAALTNLVGAGESQSRAKVKAAAAKISAGASADAVRKEGLNLAKEQAEISKRVAVAVEQVAKEVRVRGERDEEDACRKRKQGAIEDLKLDLEYANPEEAGGIKAKIRKLVKKNVREFTAHFSIDDVDVEASPAVSTPVGTSTLPGFHSI